MKIDLYSSRNPAKTSTKGRMLLGFILFFVGGILLGLAAKYTQGPEFGKSDVAFLRDAASLLQLKTVFAGKTLWVAAAVVAAALSATPLRAVFNVFFGFLGACAAYCSFSVLYFKTEFTGDMKELIIWAAIITVLSYLVWYAKGKGILAVLISTAVLTLMAMLCFDVGIWYFKIYGVVTTLLYIVTVIVLYKDPWQTVAELLLSFAAAYAVAAII